MAQLIFACSLITLAIFWFTRSSSPPIPAEFAPKTVNAEARVVPVVSSAPNLVRATTLEKINENLNRASTLSQTELDNLYSQARDLIQSDEQGFLKSIPVEKLVGESFEKSFFATSAWIRYSHAPTEIIQKLSDFKVEGEKPILDIHHPGMTPSIKLERLRSYSIRETRKQIEKGLLTLNEQDETNLVNNLKNLTTNKPSLDLSLEVFQLLSVLKEHAVIEVALSNYSESDRELIRSATNIK